MMNNNPDDPGHAVIYFGGDVQDTPEMMEENRDTKGYIKFNLDNTAMILREAFPRSFIIVVRPVRYAGKFLTSQFKLSSIISFQNGIHDVQLL